MQRHVLDGEPELAYVGPDHDRGATVLLLHGLSADTTSWAPDHRLDSATTTAPTRSTSEATDGRPTSPAAYRLDGYVDDADRMLQLIGEPTIVVGHSLGAIVATALAQDSHPLVDRRLPRGSAAVPRAARHVPDEQLRTHLSGHARRHHADAGEGASVDVYRDLLAGSPHPAGRQARRPPPRGRARGARRRALADGSGRDHLGDRRHDVRPDTTPTGRFACPRRSCAPILRTSRPSCPSTKSVSTPARRRST